MTSAEEACREAYRHSLRRAYREEFGIHDDALADYVAAQWFHPDARHDHRFQELDARLPRARRVLDLASGMGTAVLRGLTRGLDMYGIEPDAEKLALTRLRIDAGDFPPAWKRRFPRAVGENLPFKDATFDAVLSYQTLEHVQDPRAVIGEMLRVVRSGGALHLRCPDYRGTFEGHYRLPWLPFLPRPLARLYLRALGRPGLGLRGIRYVSRPGLVKMLRAAARAVPGTRLEILDLENRRLSERLRGKNLPGARGPALFWKALFYARRLFRQELQVNLWVGVRKADATAVQP